MVQFASRGLRNAPVKKMRNMCANIAAMNSSADQWWTWRANRPPRTSNEMCRALAYAWLMDRPRRLSNGPS